MVFLVPLLVAILSFLDAVLMWRGRGSRYLEGFRGPGVTSLSRLS